MKKLIACKLAFVFLLGSLTSLGPISVSWAQSQSSCENGECIEKLIDRLENLGEVFKKQCLPSEGLKSNDLKSHFEENGLSEQCWKLITEINHLEAELQKHETRLNEKLGCETGECKQPHSDDSLNSQLTTLTRVEQNLSCTEPKKQTIKNQCPNDMACVLTATALGVGGYLAELVVPDNIKPNDCHLGDDSCMTQLATGFLKSVISFFEGAWDLLKMAGKKASQKMTDFWNWVSGAENHSSTSQLAMAKASEDQGVFDMLVNDFPGTIKKMFTALVSALKEWMKTDIFCQKWSGAPHFSTCQTPTESFDCIPCKTMVNGICAISGTIIAEIVPSFLTGGLVTAAKHGMNGAAKIARLFKVSDSGLKAIKNSKVAKLAVQTSTKVDDVLKVSKGLKAAKVAVEAALKAIRTYLLSPTRKILKQSIGVLTQAVKSGGVYVAESRAGKILIFSGKTLKTAGKIIIYPIENPMTTFAFKAGERSFEKLFKLGAPKLAKSTTVSLVLAKHESALDTLIAKIEEAKIKPSKSSSLVALEEELLAKIRPKRKELLKQILESGEVEFEDILKHVYPELQYGDLAKKLSPDQILAGEKELYLEIEKMADGPIKEKLFKKYNAHIIQGEARARVVGDKSPTYKQIIDNSKLEDKARFKEALTVIKRVPKNPEEEIKLARALQEAHLTGPDNGVFEYTFLELREKHRVLIAGGFTKEEADLLLRTGLAGRPPVRQLVKPGDTIFHGYPEEIIDGHFLTKKQELIDLIKAKTPAEQKGVIGKIKGMFGSKSNEAAEATLENLESLYFIDYSDQIDELDHILIGNRKLSKATLPETYEKEAFTNFRETRSYLLSSKPEVNKQTLLDIHKRMMKGGIEGVSANEMGKIRDGHWFGNVPKSNSVDILVKNEIEANPYLTWVEHGMTSDGKFYGQIRYPNVEDIRKPGLDLIRKKHEPLVKEIEAYQELPNVLKQKRSQWDALSAEGKKSPEGIKLDNEIWDLSTKHTQLVANKLNVTKRLVEAMVDDLMDWFTRERTLIGEINSPEKLDQYVNLLSKFQRDLVSIHPIANGNGRSTREILSYALMKEGFPPPRILDPNADIYRSLDDWKKIIKDGILASDAMVDDLTERLKYGLPIENSLELVTPYTRPGVKMGLKGVKKVTEMDGIEYIDPRFYREVLKREMLANPSLVLEIKSNPTLAWKKINARIEELHKKNNIYYNHAKNGVERVQLGIIDDDFKVLYGKPSFHDKDLFDFKMKTWYSEDITWRGLASKHEVKTEDDITEMFRQLTTHNASNAVLGKVSGMASPEDIRKAALADFEKYNNDVFGDGLVQMARDHSETGPMYGISYGYSTSKNRDVGKAFAMGAMVVGEYGAHKAPELQALLKSRVLVGARRANKDVDLGRLKQVREEFSYKYGRQQEVMGIGASDPDAITIIQTIDAQGGVTLTYLRNKNNPKEIFVIKGDIDPDATPLPDQIVKSIFLK
jgi:hypothetical protein